MRHTRNKDKAVNRCGHVTILQHESSAVLTSGVKKPKVEVKREKTSLGWAYRIDGTYAGATGLTRASAQEGAKQMLLARQERKRAAQLRRGP
jgi:hypothetical protein